jgi:hypothetical protein
LYFSVILTVRNTFLCCNPSPPGLNVACVEREDFSSGTSSRFTVNETTDYLEDEIYLALPFHDSNQLFNYYYYEQL